MLYDQLCRLPNFDRRVNVWEPEVWKAQIEGVAVPCLVSVPERSAVSVAVAVPRCIDVC